MPTNKGRKQQNLAYHRPTKTRKPMPRVNEAQTAIMRTVHDIRTHARELKSHRSAEKADA